jgi:hypothetical protein
VVSGEEPEPELVLVLVGGGRWALLLVVTVLIAHG